MAKPAREIVASFDPETNVTAPNAPVPPVSPDNVASAAADPYDLQFANLA
eukprot:CAMPEP_0197292046 /NCGR_PEP_ID=MMETSP0890-20130614/21027_1 /TAXON_ID=44058 ORGANISM="Aureoumbra lagunensis, Strain CCMP1510" /NCGR_SAMPLE_ID=MMETSP0890 /ASSEMBLY_ACC=CAM_ASM_000533 /LENGTH=49 /DNA_ID=CAMNT_0042765645 /DNA_START=301 /DNA_END=450 /DNA_ORIENTATION=-